MRPPVVSRLVRKRPLFIVYLRYTVQELFCPFSSTLKHLITILAKTLENGQFFPKRKGPLNYSIIINILYWRRYEVNFFNRIQILLCYIYCIFRSTMKTVRQNSNLAHIMSYCTGNIVYSYHMPFFSQTAFNCPIFHYKIDKQFISS